jgi:hypothetical protein
MKKPVRIIRPITNSDMVKVKEFILSAFLTAYLPVSLSAQDCAQALRLARAIYDQGRLQEVETYLKPCFSEKSGTSQKALMVEAYKLLCLSHIYLEEPEKADADMLNIKRTDPYYRPNEGVDPAEYVALYRTYRENPVYRYGIILGLNAARPNIRQLNTAVPLAEGSRVKQGIAFHFGAGVELPLNERLTLQGKLLYNPYRFNITEHVLITDPFTGERRNNQFQGRETQNWIVLPAQMEYNFLHPSSRLLKKLDPYVGGGVSWGYLTSARMTAERVREGQTSIPEANVDLERNKINLGISLSGGIKTQVGNGKLIFELKYTHGITNISSPEKAYRNEQLLMDYYYADPVFSMTTLEFCVMYMLEKYNPRKITPKTP